MRLSSLGIAALSALTAAGCSQPPSLQKVSSESHAVVYDQNNNGGTDCRSPGDRFRRGPRRWVCEHAGRNASEALSRPRKT
jgi:hypothetical protein